MVVWVVVLLGVWKKVLWMTGTSPPGLHHWLALSARTIGLHYRPALSALTLGSHSRPALPTGTLRRR